MQVGKAWGIVVVGMLLAIAWSPPATLCRIFVLKLEILVQLTPAFFVGLYWKPLALWVE